MAIMPNWMLNPTAFIGGGRGEVPEVPTTATGGVPITFSPADIEYLYSSIDPEKSGDIRRILKSLGGGPFSIEQLRTGANLRGLSKRSLGSWGSVLGRLSQAVAGYKPGAGGAGGTPAGGDPSRVPQFGSYLTPTGDIQKYLMNLILGGPEGFMKLFGGAPQIPAANIPAGPGEAPESAGESALLRFMQDPFLTSMAGGQIPPGIMAAFRGESARQRAATTESFGRMGARFGTDLAGTLGREEGEALDRLLAETERRALEAQGIRGGFAQQAGALANQRMLEARALQERLIEAGLSADTARQIAQAQLQTSLQESGLKGFLGLAAGLLGTEAEQRESAERRLWEDYLRSVGLPPEISGLLGLGGLGGGTTTTRGVGGGGGGDFLGGAAGTILPLLLSFALGGVGAAGGGVGAAGGGGGGFGSVQRI